MGRNIVAGAVQLGPASASKAETVERMVSLVYEAARSDAEFLTFPELALTPYFCAKVREEYDQFFDTQMPSAETEPLFRAAKEKKIAFLLPYAEKQGDTYFNSAIITDNDGQILGKFRKIHIPGAVEPRGQRKPEILEKRYFTPGDLGFPVFQTAKAKVGALICYDRRFPESFRCLGLEGAEVICAPYNTPTFGRPKEEGQAASELAICGGACANHCFAIGAGKAGVEDGEEFIGGSFIARPSGEIIAKAVTSGDELVIASLDLEKIEEVRRRLDLEGDRRPEAYSRLVEA